MPSPSKRKHEAIPSGPPNKRRGRRNEENLPPSIRPSALKSQQKTQSLYVDGTEDSQVSSQEWIYNLYGLGSPNSTKQSKTTGISDVDAIEISSDEDDNAPKLELEPSQSGDRLLVNAWVSSVNDTGPPDDVKPPKLLTVCDAAVQTDLSRRDIDVTFAHYERVKTLLNEANNDIDNAQHQLKVDLGYAQRSANAGWAKYHRSESQRKEVEAERDSVRGELVKSVKEKEKAVAEAEYWKKMFMQMGQKMSTTGKKILDIAGSQVPS